jgi:hypothetical protein
MENKADWQIGDLYRQAWQIVKTHKILWIFGMVAAATSGGFRGNFSNFGNLNKQSTATSHTTPSVPAMADSFHAIGQAVMQLFSHVPVWIYGLLIIEFIVTIIFGFVILYIYQQWALGSLLAGVQLAIEKKPVSIEESSTVALHRLPTLLWLGFVPGVCLIIVFFVLGIPLIAGLILGNAAIKIITGILLTLVILAWITIIIGLSLSMIWALRRAIDEPMSGMAALKAGFHMAKKKFWSMLLLGMVNGIAVGFVIVIPIIILVVIGVIGFVIFIANNAAGPILLMLAVPLFLVFMVGFPVLLGIATAFKTTVWSLAYMTMKGHKTS